ncbi:MAG: hypothetical protein E6Q61_04330 [Nitrosomonas sp.]|nr:MAG: hypothetical protein E6Q61_04330 [Nitrosomonas sp.]
MSPQQKDAILDATSSNLSNQLDGYYQELIRRIRNGESPRQAINEITRSFPAEYAEILAPAFTSILGASIGSREVLNLKVSGIKLSNHLYEGIRSVSTNSLKVINDHLRGFQDARKLALQLFEGFGFNPNEPLKISPRVTSLPKYLRNLVSDPIVRNELDTFYKRAISRARVNQIKTPALKAAYLDALEAIENNAGMKALENKLKVAFYERGRFFANRIAQTELHRAWVNNENDIIQRETEVEFVQVTLSASHAIVDICDLFSKQNKFGLGPGIYPKHLAPKPSYHPFCRCSLVPRFDIPLGTQYKERKGADRAFLKELSVKDASKVMGSRAKLTAVLKGKDALDVFNKRITPFYRIKAAGLDDEEQPIIKPADTADNKIVKDLPAAPPPAAQYWDKATLAGQWHEASFTNAPVRMKEIIRDTKQPDKILTTRRAGQYFYSADNVIEMGSADLNVDRHRGIWRHEYGHSIDYHYGRSKNAVFRYWSLEKPFVDAADADAEAMIKASHYKTLVINQQEFKDIKTDFGKLTNQEKEQFLINRFKESGLDFNNVRASAKKFTASEDDGVLDEKNLNRYLNFIHAWEKLDFNRMFISFLINSSDANQFRDGYKKGYLSNMSDLIGSITLNKVGGLKNTGAGHEDKYYKKNMGASKKEAFANMFDYYGLQEQFLIQMMERFAPNATKIFKDEFL